jgi:hypothetical protein
MELSETTRSELLRRLAGGAHDTASAASARPHSAVAQLNLLVFHAVQGSDLQLAHQSWQDYLGTLSASRVVRHVWQLAAIWGTCSSLSHGCCKLDVAAQEDDKRRAAEFITLAARECDVQTFLRCWSAWGASLTSMLQTEAPVQIRAAAWAAMSCIIARHANVAAVQLKELRICHQTTFLHVRRGRVKCAVQAGCRT